MTETNGADSPQPHLQGDRIEVPEVIPPSGIIQSGLGANGSVNKPDAGSNAGGGDEDNESDVVSPAKVIRIGAMLKQLLEEVRNTSVDEAAREQLSSIYNNSIDELKEALSPDLGEELDALSFDFNDGAAPTESEIRMAQAQLVGWLEGLFHGIQAIMMAQQMAARQQIEGARPEMSGGAQGPASGPGYI